MLNPSKNQHLSSQIHINHGVKPNYISTYTSGFEQDSNNPITTSNQPERKLLTKFLNVPTKKNFRRFPQRYTLPKDSEKAKPSVNTLWWYRRERAIPASTSSESNVSCSSSTTGTTDTRPLCHSKRPHTSATPLSVLAAAQQPYPTNNTWKYSYKFKK